MATIICPPPDEQPWPTLGPYVCQWIEENLCHGPGDLFGSPVRLSGEQRAWIYRMYEVEPSHLETRRGGVITKTANPRAGRRRFQRCALSLRKGSAKTEFAAWIAAAELHSDAPVRCAGFDGGRPIPRAVTDPYIPMISSTAEQTEELAYGALRRILEECSIGADFDIGLERIIRRSGNGKAEAVSASPNARDGARTTHQHADETHRLTSDMHKRSWRVMLANLAKRPLADPWALETTTAPEPGADSVAEATMDYAAQLLASEDPARSKLFFFHRQADESIDIYTAEGEVDEEQLREAVVDASGPWVAEWTDVDRVVEAFSEPDADRAYLERVWLNRPRQSSGIAFDIGLWRSLERKVDVPDGAPIALGFDGGRFDDATALVATHLETGHQWPLGIWERPLHLPHWEVDDDEVHGIVQDAFERYNVVRMYCDPPKWESWVSKWAGDFGATRVYEWWTNRRKPMAYAIRSWVGAQNAGELSHSGDAQLSQHVANARRQDTGLRDHQDDSPLWIVKKERKDSPLKIDGAMAAILSWEARNDAIAAGALESAGGVYVLGGGEPEGDGERTDEGVHVPEDHWEDWW